MSGPLTGRSRGPALDRGKGNRVGPCGSGTGVAGAHLPTGTEGGSVPRGGPAPGLRQGLPSCLRPAGIASDRMGSAVRFGGPHGAGLPVLGPGSVRSRDRALGSRTISALAGRTAQGLLRCGTRGLYETDTDPAGIGSAASAAGIPAQNPQTSPWHWFQNWRGLPAIIHPKPSLRQRDRLTETPSRP